MKDTQENPSISNTNKLLQLSGPKVRTLKEFSLHHHDLMTSAQLLETLNNKSLSEEVRKGLWYYTITIFYKCFKHSDARRRLWPQVVFAKRPDLMPAYDFFLNLRDRHIVHDDNPYIKAYVGLYVAKEDSTYTVKDVISNVAVFDILDKNRWQLFSELVNYAVNWVRLERIRLHELIKKEYEVKTAAELDALEELSITVPTVAQVSEKKEFDS